MIDTPDRPTPRFAPSLEPAVAERIEKIFDRWGIGPGDLVLNGGARGADILFAESGHRRGTDVEFILASDPDEYEKASVALPASIWPRRFRYLLAQHRYRVSRPDDRDVLNDYARANRDLIQRAEQLAPPAHLPIALVWDEQPAEGEGGTGDFAELARRFDAPLAIIDPTAL
jgi:hypothetical protein